MTGEGMDNDPDVDAEEIDLAQHAEEIADLELEEERESGLIIAGSGGTEEIAVSDVPNKPLQELSEAEQKTLADKIVGEIDDHEDGIPFLPLNLAKFNVWSFENCFIPGDLPGSEPQPAVIITFASADDPRGTPYILTRDRALKFASQLKKRANTGPSLEQRAAQSGLAVPPSAGGLIVPGQ